MNNIIKQLKKHKIDYKMQKYGNFVYIDGLQIEQIYFEIPMQDIKAKKEIENYLKRSKRYTITRSGFYGPCEPCYWYTVAVENDYKIYMQDCKIDELYRHQFDLIYHYCKYDKANTIANYYFNSVTGANAKKRVKAAKIA